MGVGDFVELLESKYGLREGQRCPVKGESRDGKCWLAEGGQQITKSHVDEAWVWRRCTQYQIGDAVFLRPSEIRFTQNSVGFKFRDGRTLSVLLDELTTRKRKREVDPIRVILADGCFYALNNRRLAVYRLLEIAGGCGRIKCIFTAEPEGLRHKFTTKCDGEWVDVRGVRGLSEWIGRNADETSCWACNTLPVDTVSRRREVGAFVNHHEEGLGQVVGPAENPAEGDVSVNFQDKVLDVFAYQLSLHLRPMMTIAHKLNFMARAKRMGTRLCQNLCSCGCGERCGELVCVCGDCGTPYHNEGRYCCNCAEELGLDLGSFEDEDGHRHAGHKHDDAVREHNCSDSENEF